MKPTPAEKRARRAAARIFLSVGRAAQGPWRDENTLPLFPLPLIMDCEGLLSDQARRALIEGRAP